MSCCKRWIESRSIEIWFQPFETQRWSEVHGSLSSQSLSSSSSSSESFRVDLTAVMMTESFEKSRPLAIKAEQQMHLQTIDSHSSLCYLHSGMILPYEPASLKFRINIAWLLHDLNVVKFPSFLSISMQHITRRTHCYRIDSVARVSVFYRGTVTELQATDDWSLGLVIGRLWILSLSIQIRLLMLYSSAIATSRSLSNCQSGIGWGFAHQSLQRTFSGCCRRHIQCNG